MVVIAEFYLINCNSVVFIYNGDNIVAKEGGEGIPGVQKPLPAAEVIMCYKHLRHLFTHRAKGLFIHGYKASLAKGCNCLFFRYARRPFFKPHLLHAYGNGARCYEDDLFAVLL